MVQYKCYSCNFLTNHRSNIIKHLNKKKKCERKEENKDYSDEEIFKYSLIPIDKNNNIEIKLNKNKTCIRKDRKEILKELKEYHKNSIKKCKYCNITFDKIKDLKNHILFSCDELEIIDDFNDNKEDKTDSKNTFEHKLNSTINTTINNITNNINNISNITNIESITINNNITNIYNPPLDFQNKKWDVSHLCEEKKLQLLLHTCKFTKTLEHILLNDSNLNVLIDDEDNEFGFIFANNQIEKVSIKDIIDQSFFKIYNHLKDFSKETLDNNYILHEEIDKDTEYKFNSFNDDEKIKNFVLDSMSDIYKKHTNKTKDGFDKASLLERAILNNGY